MDMETAKIFGIGFHKTGTTSLHRALRILGLRAIHGDPRFGPPFGDEGRTLLQHIERADYRLPTIARYDAFTDNPYFSIWRELDREYPGSKFILTIRDERDWLNSCIKYYQNRRVRPMRRWMFGEWADPSAGETAQEAWLAAYRLHNEQIRQHFAHRPADLLVLRIAEGEGWEKLCPFLEKPVPAQAFPAANTFQSKMPMQQRKNRFLKRLRAKATGLLCRTADLFLSRKPYYFISHPKSGRTWLAVALGKIVEELFGIPHHAVLKPYHYLKIARPGLPRIVFSHIGSGKLHADQHYFNPAGKRIFFLVRDPRDVAVSYYYQLTKRKQKFDGSIGAFIRDKERGIAKIVSYMNFFAERRRLCRDFVLLRYEDLHADMAGALGQICQITGLNASPELIQKAVEWSRFDNMQNRERQGFYTENLLELNPRNTEDANTYKVRKGKIGSHREELSAEDLAFLDDYIDRNLHPAFDFYRPGVPRLSTNIAQP